MTTLIVFIFVSTNRNNTMEAQEFKSISALRKITSGKTIYIKLSNGYYMPVVKHQLSRLAEAMTRNEHSFCGTVYPTVSEFEVHVELRK